MMEIKYNDFIISDDKSKIQINQVCKLLATSYWANNREREAIEKSIENSLCFGIYLNEKQVGFARCITDYATIFWLGDVIIDESFRKLGLGKALINAIVNHEQLKLLKGILTTGDAHGLYEQYGFHLVDGKCMRRGI